MGTVINKDACANFNDSFGKFVENPAVKGSTIVKIDKFTLTGVKTLKAGEGDFKGNLFRDAAQIASNNRTREMFKKSVADIFGGEDKIPNSVKAAMKWDDFDGTGRPLTARRISATWAQIKAEEKCDKIRNALNAQDWFSDSKISDDVKAALGSYIEQLSNEMTRAMEKLLLPSIQKGEAPSVGKMKAFLKQFQKESTAARKILDGIKNSLGNFDAETTGIDDKARQRIIEVNNAMPLARSAAFALALAKNTDVANFFFDTSEVSNQAFKNFDQAYDEIQQDYRDREFEGDEDVNANEGDSLMSNIAPLQRMAGPTRAYYIMGMSTEDAVEELMRLSKDELQKESLKQGKVLLRDAVVALEFTPGPKAKDILAGFFKKVGEQIMDGTIRKKNEGGVDPFYDVIESNLKNFMMTCMKNRELNDAKGTTDNQPEWVMGSMEQDLALLKKLDNMFKRPFIPEEKKMEDVDFATHMFVSKVVAPGIENIENAKGKFLSLGNGAKVSNEKPTPEANKATRTFLIKLLDDQGKSASKFAGGPDPVISAVKMILAHDLTKEITYGEVFDLLRVVVKSRQDSPTVQRECKKIKEKQETIRDSFLKSLENVRKVYEDDLADRNTKNKTDLFAKIRPDKIFRMIELLNPRVLQLRKEGTDVLKMVEEWATTRLQKTFDRKKLGQMEQALIKHEIPTNILGEAFLKYQNRNTDPVSVKITVQFWKTTLNDPNHPVEFLAEDATQLGTWQAQKKMVDELLGKYLPRDVKELKNHQEAHDFITELSDKDDVDWGKERDRYDGNNPVIKGMLTRFAEEDVESADDLVRRELSNLYDLIESRVSSNETTSVIENMNTISEVEMEIMNNNKKMVDLKSKIQDLQQKIERASSQSVAEELKIYQEAHDFITELSDKDDVDWGKERDKYDGDNQVIKGRLTRFAEEDEEFADDLARRELSSLYDLIDSMSNSRPELEKKQGELKKELGDLTNRNDALNKALKEKNALLNDQLKVLDRKDVQRQHSVQEEFLAVQNDGMKYQKYGEILKSA